jgi:hypothetical protein
LPAALAVSQEVQRAAVDAVCREHAANVKRWRDGQMALRWCAAGMIKAGKQFRRVNGHLHLPTQSRLSQRVCQSVNIVVCVCDRKCSRFAVTFLSFS